MPVVSEELLAGGQALAGTIIQLHLLGPGNQIVTAGSADRKDLHGGEAATSSLEPACA